MAQFSIGYAHLIANYELPARELASVCYIDTASIRPLSMGARGTKTKHIESCLNSLD